MASKFSLSMTETAVNDLDDILEYIANTLANPLAVKNLYDELSEAFQSVVVFPDAGAPVNNPTVLLNGVRKLFVKNYTVYYLPDYECEKVHILRIVYSHRDTDEIIRNLNI